MRKLFRQMGSSDKDGDVARHKLNELLAEHGLTWNDLPTILAEFDVARDSGREAASAGPPDPNLLPVLLRLLEEHIGVTAEERLAIGLWILHCWVFQRFLITPRLALLSPVRGCGKTTLLSLIELLIPEGHRTDHVTAAAIFHQLERRPQTVLIIDEADCLGLARNNDLRSVFNGGHRRGGCVLRFVGGWARRYSTFAPLAIAAIGGLPLPLLHRSVVINLQRSAICLRQLDEADQAFSWARRAIQQWAASVRLEQDPAMPDALRHRAADNWRVLLAIADAFGVGEEARAAAVTLSADRPDEDEGVLLLIDIRTIFDARGVDRISTVHLLEDLLGLGDGRWAEWCGPNDDQPPRKLTAPQLARLLRRFHIRSRTVWPVQRHPDSRSSRGYLRSQFERAWASYCPKGDTTTQTSKINKLRRP
jgi:hypothetical protein